MERITCLVKAGASGHVAALTRLGFRYDVGQGVKQNSKEAIKWYQKAADQGDASAQYNLGVMYANGRGVKQDLEEAYAWWIITAANGDEKAQESMGRAQQRKYVNQYMPAEEVALAEAQARDLMEQNPRLVKSG